SSNMGNKEPVSILLAAAALILTLTPTISKVITVLSHKIVEVEEMVLLPLLQKIRSIFCWNEAIGTVSFQTACVYYT
ncbi:MAG: hypothetical protein M3Z24_02060, partial [Chloroflexota bacterium]|nr:hypothetical protein [Chloroflexota bacterium]